MRGLIVKDRFPPVIVGRRRRMLARQIAIGFGIAIIFPLLVYYGVSTFHSAPKIQSMFATRQLPVNATADERREFNDEQRHRQEAYSDAAREFARILVIVSTPLGLAAILIGTYLTFLSVGTGLIFGGIFTVVWGYWAYWSYLGLDSFCVLAGRLCDSAVRRHSPHHAREYRQSVLIFIRFDIRSIRGPAADPGRRSATASFPASPPPPCAAHH
jgi:uncharacterized membrane protein YphA (DoxX/SURF4 family)